ncbi:hypothetical protein FHG87_003564 [Trinorchestia longiramus]|nr:hypothetical protein FHG87_003564 [Trinorchestia longiramus]
MSTLQLPQPYVVRLPQSYLVQLPQSYLVQFPQPYRVPLPQPYLLPFPQPYQASPQAPHRPHTGPTQAPHRPHTGPTQAPHRPVHNAEGGEKCNFGVVLYEDTLTNGDVDTSFRRATKMIPEHRHFCYKRRLQHLDLTSLEQKRLRGQLIKTYKYLNGYNEVTLQNPFDSDDNVELEISAIS